MFNFTMGPVAMEERIQMLGSAPIPYFRTEAFSQLMLENEEMLCALVGAPADARAVFLTGSGTAAMEAAVINCFGPHDRVLVVNGGTFGTRFCRLCEIHGVPYTVIPVLAGRQLQKWQLEAFSGQGYTGLLINMHETSTGLLYDMQMVADFCDKEGLFMVVDAISSFLCDPLRMEEWGAAVVIGASQKAPACPPGISFLVLSREAVSHVQNAEVKSLYLDLHLALQDGKRGQTPFTPAVGILLQIHAKLSLLLRNGGAEAACARTGAFAARFRNGIQELPFVIPSENLSNAMTPLHPLHVPADVVSKILQEQYGIWVCPNGGSLRKQIFRVGHIGAQTESNQDVLLDALRDMEKRGLL